MADGFTHLLTVVYYEVVMSQQLIDRRFLEEMEKDGTFERLGMK